MLIAELDTLIKAVCPIDGVDSNGGIQFAPQATPAERAAAQAVMDANLHLLVIPVF